MASKMIVRSNFRAAKEGAREGLGVAVEAWKEETESQAKNILSRREAQRGYSLDTLYASIQGEANLALLTAHVATEPFYSHFFEYGTIYIEPLPFLRPAKSKGDKAFLAVAGASVSRAIRTRAAIL